MKTNKHISFNKKRTAKSQPLIAILGAGESGIGAAVLAQKQGYNVFVSEFGSIKPQYKQTLNKHGILFEENGHNEAHILSATLVIKSPGIPEKAPIMKAIRENQLPVVSEIEFASRYTKGTIIAITGSNGKTTTTELTYKLLTDAGLEVSMCGNIGNSFAYEVATNDKAIYVIEVSSFQLDDIEQFKPHIAILTNITPDHLDRYNYNIDDYAASKFNITKNQTKEDYFIYCADDELTATYLKQHKPQAQMLPFSVEKTSDMVGFITNETLTINIKNKTEIMSVNNLILQGKHNTYNSLAAGIAGKLMNIRKESIRESLTNFKGLEHRMENVLRIGGVQFINDSKATNVNSTWYALESINQPIVWIAGGVDKGNDYSILQPLVHNKVKSIICLGKDNRNLHEAFGKHVPLMVNVTSMKEAVRVAYHFSDKGNAVLLSPACASFDLFENYEDRGRQFKESIKHL